MKKKVYKKAQAEKLPSNYRTFPEKLNRDEVAFFTGIFVILIAILIVSLDLYSNFKKQEELTKEKVRILSEVAFWQNEIKSRPNYRDAYFSLALLNFQLRDFDGARNNLDKALSLDPNFEKGREFEKILNSKY